jgi:hypothetical protein
MHGQRRAAKGKDRQHRRKALQANSRIFHGKHKLRVLTAFPDSAWTFKPCAIRRTATLLAGIRAGGNDLCRLPSRLFKATSGILTETEL